MPVMVLSLRPILSTVSIMPGMENLAPERHDTSSGFSASPNLRPTAFSTSLRYSSAWSHMPAGNLPSLE